jgi:hypothetical protein
MMLGMYAHNLFLALFTFFGVIGGLLSSLIIIVIILGAFITAKNKKTITVLLIFFSVYFVSSMVSGDILNNYGPWILLGISLSVVTTRINFHFI